MPPPTSPRPHMPPPPQPAQRRRFTAPTLPITAPRAPRAPFPRFPASNRTLRATPPCRRTRPPPRVAQLPARTHSLPPPAPLPPHPQLRLQLESRNVPSSPPSLRTPLQHPILPTYSPCPPSTYFSFPACLPFRPRHSHPRNTPHHPYVLISAK